MPWFESGDILNLVMFFIIVGFAVLGVKALYWLYPEIWND